MKKFLALGLACGLGLLVADVASAQIRFGVGGPMTGGAPPSARSCDKGVEQAVADINAAGGILGQKIQLFIGDDGADPREGVSVANKFVADGVKFIIGHFNSGVTMPASEVYQENGMLVITPAATNPKVTERNMWNIFRVCGRDDQQGALAAAIIAQRFKGKRIAFVHDKTTYGQGLADETRRAMAKGGLKDVLYEGVNKDDKRLHRADLQDPAGACRPRVLGRAARRRRPDRAPDARAGRQGAADGRRRHHRRRVRGDRRPRRRRHADDVLARPARQSRTTRRSSSCSAHSACSSRRPTRSTAMPRCRSSSRRPRRRNRSTRRRSRR